MSGEPDAWIFADDNRTPVDIARGTFTKSAEKVSGGYLVPVTLTRKEMDLSPGAINLAGHIL